MSPQQLAKNLIRNACVSVVCEMKLWREELGHGDFRFAGTPKPHVRCIVVEGDKLYLRHSFCQFFIFRLQRYAYNLHCLPREGIRKGRHPALQGELYVPGFPTLGFVPHTVCFSHALPPRRALCLMV